MFLPQAAKMKLGLRNGRKHVCLRPLPPKGPGPTAILDLLNLVPRALRIQFRIDKAGQTLLLIRLQYVHAGSEEYGSDPDAASRATTILASTANRPETPRSRRSELVRRYPDPV